MIPRGVTPTTVDVTVNPSEAASPYIAKAQAEQAIQHQSQQFFEEAKKSYQNAAYAKAMASATERLSAGVQERISQRTDKDGNPTFHTLPQDIKNISSQVLDSELQGISDPDVKERLKMQFADMAISQQMMAQKEARSQQVDFSRAAVSESLVSLQRQAQFADPALMDQYLAEGHSILAEAVRTGAMTHGELQSQFQVFSDNVQYHQALTQIKQDPKGTLEAINEGATFGLDKAKVEQLKEAGQGILNDQMRAQAQALKAQEIATKQQQKLATTELEINIEQGSGSEGDIIEAAQQGKISAQDSADLRLKLAKHTEKTIKETAASDEVRNAVMAGKPLTNMTPAAINSVFASDVAAIGDNPSLLDITQKVASTYKGEVSNYTNRLSSSLMFGSDQEAVDAVSSISYMSQVNPAGLGKLDAKDLAVYGKASTFIDAGIEPSAAIKKARESVSLVDEKTRSISDQNFSKEDLSKPKNIKDFVSDSFNGFFGSSDVNDDVVAKANTLLREAYRQTNGDIKASKKIVETQLKNFAGVTSFNGGDVVMTRPPEQVYAGVPEEVLHKDLNSSIAAIVGGEVAADRVKLTHVDGTQGYLISIDGIPFLGKNGAFQVWKFDVEGYRKETIETAQTEATQTRKDIIEDQKKQAKLSKLLNV